MKNYNKLDYEIDRWMYSRKGNKEIEFINYDSTMLGIKTLLYCLQSSLETLNMKLIDITRYILNKFNKYSNDYINKRDLLSITDMDLFSYSTFDIILKYTQYGYLEKDSDLNIVFKHYNTGVNVTDVKYKIRREFKERSNEIIREMYPLVIADFLERITSEEIILEMVEKEIIKKEEVTVIPLHEIFGDDWTKYCRDMLTSEGYNEDNKMELSVESIIRKEIVSELEIKNQPLKMIKSTITDLVNHHLNFINLCFDKGNILQALLVYPIYDIYRFNEISFKVINKGLTKSVFLNNDYLQCGQIGKMGNLIIPVPDTAKLKYNEIVNQRQDINVKLTKNKNNRINVSFYSTSCVPHINYTSKNTCYINMNKYHGIELINPITKQVKTIDSINEYFITREEELKHKKYLLIQKAQGIKPEQNYYKGSYLLYIPYSRLSNSLVKELKRIDRQIDSIINHHKEYIVHNIFNTMNLWDCKTLLFINNSDIYYKNNTTEAKKKYTVTGRQKRNYKRTLNNYNKQVKSLISNIDYYKTFIYYLSDTLYNLGYIEVEEILPRNIIPLTNTCPSCNCETNLISLFDFKFNICNYCGIETSPLYYLESFRKRYFNEYFRIKKQREEISFKRMKKISSNDNKENIIYYSNIIYLNIDSEAFKVFNEYIV